MINLNSIKNEQIKAYLQNMNTKIKTDSFETEAERKEIMSMIENNEYYDFSKIKASSLDETFELVKELFEDKDDAYRLHYLCNDIQYKLISLKSKLLNHKLTSQIDISRIHDIGYYSSINDLLSSERNFIFANDLKNALILRNQYIEKLNSEAKKKGVPIPELKYCLNIISLINIILNLFKRGKIDKKEAEDEIDNLIDKFIKKIKKTVTIDEDDEYDIRLFDKICSLFFYNYGEAKLKVNIDKLNLRERIMKHLLNKNILSQEEKGLILYLVMHLGAYRYSSDVEKLIRIFPTIELKAIKDFRGEASWTNYTLKQLKDSLESKIKHVYEEWLKNKGFYRIRQYDKLKKPSDLLTYDDYYYNNELGIIAYPNYEEYKMNYFKVTSINGNIQLIKINRDLIETKLPDGSTKLAFTPWKSSKNASLEANILNILYTYDKEFSHVDYSPKIAIDEENLKTLSESTNGEITFLCTINNQTHYLSITNDNKLSIYPEVSEKIYNELDKIIQSYEGSEKKYTIANRSRK